MDIIFTLTIRHLRKNKKRTLSIVTGIMAASVLLTLSMGFISTLLKKLEDLSTSAEDITPLMGAASAMTAIVLAVLSIFLYNMLSISNRDRRQYLWMLGSVGATPFQRGKMALVEAAVVGVLGIIPGIGIGILLAVTIFPFQVILPWKSVILIFLCESLTIFLTGLLQMKQSKSTVIELIRSQTEKRNLKKPVVLPGWILSRFGIEGYFAVKNIVFFKRRYVAAGVSIVLSMMLFLDGYIYMNYLDGYYEARDRREKEYADLVVEEAYGTRNERWDEFIAEVSKLPEIEKYTIQERANLGGTLFDVSAVKPQMESFTTYILGTDYKNPLTIYDKENLEMKGVCMNMVLIGMDDKAFTDYLDRAHIEEKDTQIRDGQIPVLIEDFPLVKTGVNVQYQSILNIEKNSIFTGVLDSDYHMIGASPESNPIRGFQEYQVRVLGVTDKPPQCWNIFENQAEEPNTLRFYTTMEGCRFFKEKYSIGDDNAPAIRSMPLRMKSKTKEIPQNLLFPAVTKQLNTITRRLKLSTSAFSVLTDEETAESLDIRAEEAAQLQKKIWEIGKKYGMSGGGDQIEDISELDYTANPYPVFVQATLADPFPMQRHMFVYGLLIFLIVISVFQILKMITSSVQLRRRELAVLLSLGMSRRQISKMTAMEGIICNTVSFLAGLIISIGLGFSMFHSWSKIQAVEMIFPYSLLIVEAVFFIGLIGVSIILSIKSVKKTDIIDIIRDETV